MVTVNSSNIIFIVGPTAVGKSTVAFELAKQVDGEIVSCDAMQVYREVKVSSDRPADEMMQEVPHHLVGVVSIQEEFNVARFRELAIMAIEDILSRGKKAIICGGSGMYVMAILDGLFEGGETDPGVRERLEKEVEEKGPLALHAQLMEKDPDAALKISVNDTRRIVRALEVIESSGQKFSDLQKKRSGLWGTQSISLVALNRSREELYKRAEVRIDQMFDRGLVHEIKEVLSLGLAQTAARLIGIPEVKGLIEGEYDLERAKYLMKRNTRHYVKRQLTWFRKDQRMNWLDITNFKTPEKVAEEIIVSFLT